MTKDTQADATPGQDPAADMQIAGDQQGMDTGEATPTGDGGGQTKEPSRADLEKSALDAILAEEGGKRKTFGATPTDDGPTRKSDGRFAGKEGGKPDADEKPGAAVKATPPDVEKAEARVRHTQQKYHEARMEIARLNKRLTELEAGPDSQAKPALDEVAEGMSEKAREMLNETPELREIVEKATEAADKKNRTREIERTKESLADIEKVSKESEKMLQQSWEESVKAAHPDYGDTLKSVDFLDWKATHPNLVNSMLRGVDQYDPSGAIKVLNAFRDSRKAAAGRRPDSRAAAADMRPGRAHQGVVPEASRSERQKSRQELESESMAAILQEERAKRRAFD